MEGRKEGRKEQEGRREGLCEVKRVERFKGNNSAIGLGKKEEGESQSKTRERSMKKTRSQGQ